MKDLSQDICYTFQRGLKWIHWFIITPAGTPLPGWFISSLWGWSPGIVDQLFSFLWYLLLSCRSPVTFHAAREMPWSISRCGWFRGEVSKFGTVGSNTGSAISISSIVVYHGWVGHTGVISTIVALSCRIFARQRPTRQNGGKPYSFRSVDLIEKASVFHAPGSGFQLTYLSSCLFMRSVNRSISTFVKAWNIGIANIQLLVSLYCLDWASAI